MQIFDRAIGQDDFSYTLKQDLPVAFFTYQDLKSREESISWKNPLILFKLKSFRVAIPSRLLKAW